MSSWEPRRTITKADIKSGKWLGVCHGQQQNDDFTILIAFPCGENVYFVLRGAVENRQKGYYRVNSNVPMTSSYSLLLD